MMNLASVIGAEEDWASYITNVEMKSTAFLDWLRIGSKPTNPLFSYQVDAFRAVRQNRHVDGTPWKEPASGGEARGRLKALMQWLEHGVSVSKISQDVTNDAAIADQLAYEITKAMKELSGDMEAACLEDYDLLEDNKVEGYRLRGVGSWLSTTAQALYPVPEAYRPPAASVFTTAHATMTEDNFCDMLTSIWDTAETDEEITAFASKTWFKTLRNFQFRLPQSDSTAQTTFQRQFRDKTISRSVRRYEGDFMNVEFVPTRNNIAITGTGTAKAGRAYFLHQSMWEGRWHQKPRVYRPESKGGSYEAFMDALFMLVAKNPRAEGMHKPA